MSATQIQRVSHRHEAIIDFLLSSPDVKDLTVLCQRLNVTRSWLSVVMRSDAFRLEYTRRREAYNQELAGQVQRKLYDTSLAALDQLLLALKDVDDPRFALDVADKMSAKLGFGPQKGTAPVVELHQHNTVQVADKTLLQDARESMRLVNGQRAITQEE